MPDPYSMVGDLGGDVCPLEIFNNIELSDWAKIHLNLNLNCKLDGRQTQTWGLSVSTQRHDSQGIFLKVALKVSQMFAIFVFSSLLTTLKKLHCHLQSSRFLLTTLDQDFCIP